MMIRVLSCLILIGCSSSSQSTQPEEPATPSEPAAPVDAPADTPPDTPVASPEPAGNGDEPTKPEPAGRVECAKEIALTCQQGMKDGCLLSHPKDKKRQLTTHHVCVSEKEKGGIGCEKEIARQCPQGQVDACLMQPAVADTHVCVEEKPAP